MYIKCLILVKVHLPLLTLAQEELSMWFIKIDNSNLSLWYNFCISLNMCALCLTENVYYNINMAPLLKEVFKTVILYLLFWIMNAFEYMIKSEFSPEKWSADSHTPWLIFSGSSHTPTLKDIQITRTSFYNPAFLQLE